MTRSEQRALVYPKDHQVNYEEEGKEGSGPRYRWGLSDRDPNAIGKCRVDNEKDSQQIGIIHMRD